MTFATFQDGDGAEVLELFEDRGKLDLWIGGRSTPSASERRQQVFSPYNGGVLGEVPLADQRDVDQAVAAAAAAQVAWGEHSIKDRAAVMYRLRELLWRELEELSRLVALENGKTPNEAKAEILKGIEVLEFACSLPHLTAGRVLEVGEGIDCMVTREPLGVVASITPFNFPVMVPMWTIPIAITLGNTFLLKPSEQVPLAPLRLAELLSEAGLPDGVFNVILGDRATAELLCDHPGIRALSFVGSTAAARAVYTRGCAAGKRVLALGGAKNHLIVLPDAEPEATAKAIADAATGCAGQRCMAASVLVTVGDCSPLLDALVEYARGLEVPRDMGAIINSGSVQRIQGHVDQALAQGAKPLVDGRHPRLPEPLSEGFWFGPTLLGDVLPHMPAARDEIFGPVLSIVSVATLEEAIQIENASPYGNAASVFTSSGEAARRVVAGASAGMVGVNIGIPVPRDPFAFGGWNESKFGVGDITGESSVNFWTQDKKVTARWPR